MGADQLGVMGVTLGKWVGIGNNPKSNQISQDQFMEGLMKQVIDGKDSEVTFDKFPYYLSERIKFLLTNAGDFHLRPHDLSKYTRNLSPLSQAILLSGHTEIYHHMLAQALANCFESKLLCLDIAYFSLKMQGKYGYSTRERDSKRSIFATALEHVSGLFSCLPILPSKAPSKCKSRYCFDEKLFIDSLYKVLVSISETGSVILYIKNVEKIFLQSPRMYSLFQKLLNKLSGSVLILGSSSYDLIDDCIEVNEKLTMLFPYNIEIKPPQDKTHLKIWTKHLEMAMEMTQLKDGTTRIAEVFATNDIDCNVLDSISHTDMMLLSNYTEEIVASSIFYHLKNTENPEYRNGILTISAKSLCHVLRLFQEGVSSDTEKDKNDSENESKKDVAEKVKPISNGTKKDGDIKAISNGTQKDKDTRAISNGTQKDNDNTVISNETQKCNDIKPILSGTKKDSDIKSISSGTKKDSDNKAISNETQKDNDIKPISNETQKDNDIKPISNGTKKDCDNKAISNETQENNDIKPISSGTKKDNDTKPISNGTKKASDIKATEKANVPRENSFEKCIRQELIPANEIKVSFSDIGALDDVKESLQEAVMLPLRRPDLFEGDGILKPCKGALLFGPPGTGKTMLAKAIANEAGASFINVSSSTISAKWYGDSEKIVRALFSLAAKVAPTIIFIDEVDSMLGMRSMGESSASRRIKNEFMTHWDGLLSKPAEKIIVLAATNMPFCLDEAVIRRFQRRIMVGLPSAENREAILKTLLAKEKHEDIDFEELSTMTKGYSGSDLKNLCMTAAHGPIKELMQQEKDKEMKKKKKEAEAEVSEVASDATEEDQVIVLRPLNMEDMREAMSKVTSSFDEQGSNMEVLTQWNDLYGEGGSRKKKEKQPSYYI